MTPESRPEPYSLIIIMGWVTVIACGFRTFQLVTSDRYTGSLWNQATLTVLWLIVLAYLHYHRGQR